MIDSTALELRVSDILGGAIVHSENVCTAALLVIMPKARPVAEVSIDLEGLLITLFHNGEVMSLLVIVAVKCDCFEVGAEGRCLFHDTFYKESRVNIIGKLKKSNLVTLNRVANVENARID